MKTMIVRRGMPAENSSDAKMPESCCACRTPNSKCGGVKMPISFDCEVTLDVHLRRRHIVSQAKRTSMRGAKVLRHMVRSTEPPTITNHSNVTSWKVPLPTSPKMPRPKISIPKSKWTSAVMRPRFTSCTRKTMYITFRPLDVTVFGRCRLTSRTMMTSKILLRTTTAKAARPPHAPAATFAFSQPVHWDRMPEGTSAKTDLYPAASQTQAF
mmetsp:Transcript_87373/g.271446  ORF Transcript_87373/g.271446 Transcript_87373/m.271446 type:complete len:212 (-) Transcript_87373:100-735(-)